MIVLNQTESIDSAYRRLVREMIVNDTFKEIEKNKYRVLQGEEVRDKRRAWKKTKRKRAAARRKNKHKMS